MLKIMGKKIFTIKVEIFCLSKPVASEAHDLNMDCFHSTKAIRIGISIYGRIYYYRTNLSCDMRLPTMWYVQSAKPLISLRI